MATEVTNHLRAKIGVNRGRRRVWLDGARLTQAGFTGGTVYRSVAKAGAIDCHRLSAEELAERATFVPPPAGTVIADRKVTGRANGKPVIDITGKVIDLAFPTAEAVDVRFHKDLIEIRPAN